MALRVRHTVRVEISRDADGRMALWNPDINLSEVVLDTFTKHTAGNFQIPIATTEDVSLGDIAAVRGLYLEVLGTAEVFVNGSLNAMVLTSGHAPAAPAKLFLEAPITQLQVRNPSTTEVLEGFHVMWGDLA